MILDKVSSPYLIQCTEDQLNVLSQRKETFYLLDGVECKTLNNFFTEISEKLNFPEYFGRNLNALLDCLTDLEWLEESQYLICVRNAESFLIEEKEEVFMGTLNYLEEVAFEWSQKIKNGESWDREPIPFHIVFTPSSSDSSWADRLKNMNMMVPDLEVF